MRSRIGNCKCAEQYHALLIEKIRDIIGNGVVIDMAPEFRAIYRTTPPYRNLQLRMLPEYKQAVTDMHAKKQRLLWHACEETGAKDDCSSRGERKPTSARAPTANQCKTHPY